MNTVMTPSTKGNTITDFYSKFRCFFPRFNMMNNEESWFHYFSTFLASIFVSFQTGISPFKVQITPKTTFEFFAGYKILARYLSFGLANLRPFNLTVTFYRTVFSFMSIISISPIRFTADLTILIKTRLSHTIILSRNSYEINTN